MILPRAWCTAAATHISALFGKGKSGEAGQISADLLRLTFACGAFVPAVLLPGLKECGGWFRTSEKIVELGWDYTFPLCSFTTTTFVASYKEKDELFYSVS